MARDLTAAMQAQAVAARVRPVLFYEGEFSTGFLRLWSGLGTISWDSKTWTGAGNLLAVSEITETTEVRAVGITCQLSGMPSSLISTALAAARHGLPGKVWLGLLQPEAYLSLPGEAGDFASTPDSAALDITGDIDIRCKAAGTDWSPSTQRELVAKNTTDSSQFSYLFRLNTSGYLTLYWSENGTTLKLQTSSEIVPTSDGTIKWVRATLDVDNGAGGYSIRFYYSDDGNAWTQLGTTKTAAGVTSIFSGTGVVRVGARGNTSLGPFDGKIYYAEIRNGIDGDPVAIFDPHFIVGTTGSMPTGERWTINQSGSPVAEVIQQDAVIADPYLAFDGRLDVPVIDDAGDTCTIAISYESRLIDLEKARERRWTHDDQQIDFAGDLGFEYVPGLPDQVLTW